MNLVKALLLDPDEGWLKSLQDRYNLKLYLLSASARIQSGQARGAGQRRARGGSERSSRAGWESGCRTFWSPNAVGPRRPSCC